MGVIHHFLRNTFKGKEPLRQYCSFRWHNRVANILQNIQGVGLRIEKPTDGEGLGWKIINDGSTDIDSPVPTNKPLDPRTHEIQNVDLIEDDPDTGAVDRHTLKNFGAAYGGGSGEEPDPDPDTWRVCLWKPATLIKDAVLQWPLLVTAIGDAIITYITTLTTGAAWPSGTVPPDHDHSAHSGFAGDDHAGQFAGSPTHTGYPLLGLITATYHTPAEMYARNKGGTGDGWTSDDVYLGASTHLQGRLHTGATDAVPSGAGAGDIVTPAAASVWVGSTRLQLQKVTVLDMTTDPPGQKEAWGLFAEVT